MAAVPAAVDAPLSEIRKCGSLRPLFEPRSVAVIGAGRRRGAVGAEIFHTYSTYARGVECLTDAYSLLDTTPYGRQEDWEDSPAGVPQKPTYE